MNTSTLFKLNITKFLFTLVFILTAYCHSSAYAQIRIGRVTSVTSSNTTSFMALRNVQLTGTVSAIKLYNAQVNGTQNVVRTGPTNVDLSLKADVSTQWGFEGKLSLEDESNFAPIENYYNDDPFVDSSGYKLGKVQYTFPSYSYYWPNNFLQNRSGAWLDYIRGWGSLSIDRYAKTGSLKLTISHPFSMFPYHPSIGYGDIHITFTVEGIIPGDVNADGLFDSNDLMIVMQSNQFEDGIQGNSSWLEGDWNGDKEFDTNDLLLALQAGNYK